ncbi:hypothetical protein, partial [Legionella sp. 29fVS95]|uniref:hypothetical protein n=1 Tax=Legionella sp. 29fVS95 TaxID=3402813 RepID=UPI003AF57BFB
VYETFIVTVGYSNPRLQPAAFPPRYPINQSVHSLDEAQRNQGIHSPNKPIDVGIKLTELWITATPSTL